MSLRRWMALTLVIAALPASARGEDKPEPSQEYLQFVRARVAALRAADTAPANLDDWTAQKAAVRKNLLDAWGGFPAEACPLDARVLGTLDRDGYRVEKVVFQTLPGILMTANAYVPEGTGKHPAILQVHGHWNGAKQDPVVQSRCIGAVKLGFFVLAVDAFGAGERGIGKALGEYHGGMTGAMLLPIGRPLSGLQVYENMRAVDYLRTRPEVDGDHIGITGASGGGNQSMYSGAWDERLSAVVPVCSVGNYGAYIGGACCMCEVVPGAVRFCDEWGLLGMVAPRALMVVNATQDAPQFSVAEARKSLALASPIFALFHKPNQIRHAIFESHHDYNQAMREAMYGWMAQHLKGQGDGSPIPEPPIKTEPPETLRCYPGETRPDDWSTIPRFAAAEARRLVAAKAVSDTLEGWRAEAEARKKALVEKVFGGFPKDADGPFMASGGGGGFFVHMQAEPDMAVSPHLLHARAKNAPLAVLIDFEDPDERNRIQDSGMSVVEFDLRATRFYAWPNDKIGSAPDHNTAEWGLWIGRPLLGQWVYEVRRVLDAVAKMEGKLPREVVLIGKGRGGLVALCAGAVDPRITKVVAIDALASYVTEKPYEGQTLGVMAPGILREAGDVAQIAALIAPRRVVIAGGVSGTGERLSREQLGDAYKEASRAWELLGAKGELSLLETGDIDDVFKALAR